MPYPNTLQSPIPVRDYGQPSLRGGAAVKTIAATVALSKRSPPVQVLDGGGAGRDVTLPAIADYSGDSVAFMLRNAGSTNSLVVKEHANDGGSTIATIAAGEWAQVVLADSDDDDLADAWTVGAHTITL